MERDTRSRQGGGWGGGRTGFVNFFNPKISKHIFTMIHSVKGSSGASLLQSLTFFVSLRYLRPIYFTTKKLLLYSSKIQKSWPARLKTFFFRSLPWRPQIFHAVEGPGVGLFVSAAIKSICTSFSRHEFFFLLSPFLFFPYRSPIVLLGSYDLKGHHHNSSVFFFCGRHWKGTQYSNEN